MSTIHKDIRNNWAISEDTKLVCGRTLRISTSKVCSGNLVTTATVGVADKNVFSYIAFQDFNERLECSKPTRCTAGVVSMQHLRAMGKVDELVATIAKFYRDTPLNDA